MSVLPGEVCTCMCHDPDLEVHHVMACCSQCPHCGFNISFGCSEEHEERCKKEREEQGLPLNQHSILNDLSQIESLSMSERVARDIERQAVEEMTKEESPAVKFLRECQEREKKLGVK